jgi:hypothetical protein
VRGYIYKSKQYKKQDVACHLKSSDILFPGDILSGDMFSLADILSLGDMFLLSSDIIFTLPQVEGLVPISNA